MELTKEDYQSYKAQQMAQLRAALMSAEAIEKLLVWLDYKIKKTKSKIKV